MNSIPIIFTAEICLQQSGVFLADIYISNVKILELTTEVVSGCVAVYRGGESYRTKIDRKLGFDEVFNAIDHLLDGIIFENPFSCTFAKNVIRYSAEVIDISRNVIFYKVFSQSLEELYE